MAPATISTDELAARLTVRREVPLAVVDVRERWEFSDGHVPDSSPLPRGQLEMLAPPALPDRSTCIVLVSSHGERARQAALTLRDLGYANVLCLAGGLAAWRSAGQPIATGWGAPGKRLGEQMAHATADLQADAAEVARWCAGGEALVIDIRPRWEHEQGHVPGAYHVPAGELPLHAATIAAATAQGRYRHVVTHCAGRTRGIAAAALLRELGVAGAVALRNGCMGWLLDGRTLEFGPTAALSSSPAPVDAAIAARASISPAQRIDVATLLARFERQESFYAVDVRLPDAYCAGHVPGSVSLPAGQVLLESEAVLPVAALPVVVIGANDVQADWAASHLRLLGWRDVSVLAGGVDAWGASRALARGLDAAWTVTTTVPRELEISPGEWQRDPARWDVLDVRSVGEWGIAHLPDSRCVPRGSLERVLPELQGSAQPLLLVSSRGVRASLAAQTLRSLLAGRREVRVLAGGLQAVRAAGMRLIEDAPDSSMASRDTPGRVSAAVWRMPLERTRPLMLRYLAWEEALVPGPT